MSRGNALWTILVVTGLLCGAAAQAQMPIPYLSMGVRSWSEGNTCANAPGPCDGQTGDMNLGPHEFFLHRVEFFGVPSDTVLIELFWPDAWEVLGWELCYGTLVAGDPAVQGSTIRVEFPTCPEGDPRPFLRIWMDCTVPGTFAAGERRVHLCDWEPSWEDEIHELYVDIGDFCGRAPHGHCDLCAYPSGVSGYFPGGPVEIDVPQGQMFSDTLFVHGDLGPYCPGLPECGAGWGACFVGIHADSSWMSATILGSYGEGYQEMQYRLAVDATTLAIGPHSGRVWSSSGCGCIPNCVPVTVNVLDPVSAEPLSWPPGRNALGAPIPNPASNGIRFSVHLAHPSRARVQIFDAGGRLRDVVVDRELPSGESSHRWEPGRGPSWPNGVYFLRLEADGTVSSRMFVLGPR